MAGNRGGSLSSSIKFSSTLRPRAPQAALTLVELMIVILIVGIVAIIAVPSYLENVRVVNRTEAKTALFAVSSDLQRYFSSVNAYVNDAQPLSSPAVPGRVLDTQTGLYRITVTACEGGLLRDCFLATAVPRGTQTQDACTEFSIDSRGRRMAESPTLSAADCWNR